MQCPEAKLLLESVRAGIDGISPAERVAGKDGTHKQKVWAYFKRNGSSTQGVKGDNKRGLESRVSLNTSRYYEYISFTHSTRPKLSPSTRL